MAGKNIIFQDVNSDARSEFGLEGGRTWVLSVQRAFNAKKIWVVDSGENSAELTADADGLSTRRFEPGTTVNITLSDERMFNKPSKVRGPAFRRPTQTGEAPNAGGSTGSSFTVQRAESGSTFSVQSSQSRTKPKRWWGDSSRELMEPLLQW